ncbi:MAG: pyridoxamine 5'-phosphate oxidase family protein [Chloroflexi bacterium]|nr:pyridoxamine 5'-phosphate oxidase family protein [Chloroflexota bacterium]
MLDCLIEIQGVVMPMIQLTDEMRLLIDNALANKTPCILATASRDGDPALGFRGSMMVFSEESLAFWERTRGKELEHIRENPKVVVLFRDPTRRVGWKLYGTAIVHAEGPIREQVMARTVQPELDRDPERKGVAVVIQITRVTDTSGRVQQTRE